MALQRDKHTKKRLSQLLRCHCVENIVRETKQSDAPPPASFVPYNINGFTNFEQMYSRDYIFGLIYRV